VLTHASVSCCRKKRVKALYFIGYLYYGGEGGLKPRLREDLALQGKLPQIAAIAFTAASFQTSLLKLCEVARSTKSGEKQ
jgi:hypothetical protein